MITSVQIENIKGIVKTGFEAKQITIFAGVNRQGKTSALRAVEWGLGAELKGSTIIHNKVKDAEARIKLTTDKGMVIERAFATGAKKSRLSLHRADGTAIPDPEKLMKSVFTDMAFDPIRLIFMPPKEQVAIVKDALASFITITPDEAIMLGFTVKDGVPVKDQLDAHYKTVFDNRAVANKVVKTLQSKATVAGVDHVPDEAEITAAEKIVEKVNADYMEAVKKAAQIEAAKANEGTRTRLETLLKELDAELEEVKSFGGLSLTQLQQRLNDLTEAFKTTSSEEVTLRAEVRQLEKTLKDLGDGKFPVCPVSTKIACNTDVSGIKGSIVTECEEKSAKLQEFFAINKTKSEELKTFEAKVENFRRLDAKKLERSRIKATLDNLGVTAIEDASDPNELKKTLEEMRETLNRLKMAKEMSNATGLVEEEAAAEKLDIQVKAIRKFIDEELPKRTDLGIPNIELRQEGIFYQGLPMMDECTSIQLQISSAIVKKIYPKSKMLTIDRLEVLDPVTLVRFLQKVASEREFQLFATYVGVLPNEVSSMSNVKVVHLEKGVVV